MLQVRVNVFPIYRNDPKFLDRHVWANSANPDQTALRPGSTLFAILFASFGLHYSMVDKHCSNFRIITAIFRVFEYLGILR